MKPSYEFRIYEAKDGWRWRLVAGNGRIVADSAEAYTTSGSAKRAADSLVASQWVIGGRGRHA